jgi:hypothetical protein
VCVLDVAKVFGHNSPKFMLLTLSLAFTCCLSSKCVFIDLLQCLGAAP